MRVTDEDAERVIQPLIQDLMATLGDSHESSVRDLASQLRSFIDDPATFEDRLVDDVQQLIHDEFVHTSWPPCPRHPNHPLWFDGEKWRCTRDSVGIARLGELGTALR